MKNWLEILQQAVQKEIETVSLNREKFIATEKAKRTTNKNEQTLQTEMEKIIKVQAKRFNVVIN